MSKRWWFGGVALCVVVVLTLSYQRWWLGPEITADTVTVGDMVQTLVASGHVQSPHRIDVSAQITSTVMTVEVIWALTSMRCGLCT